MKLLIEPASKNSLNLDNVNGLILSLKDYSVQSPIYFDLEEIKQIKKENPSLELFININKNLLNSDIEIIYTITSDKNLNLFFVKVC